MHNSLREVGSLIRLLQWSRADPGRGACRGEQPGRGHRDVDLCEDNAPARCWRDKAARTSPKNSNDPPVPWRPVPCIVHEQPEDVPTGPVVVPAFPPGLEPPWAAPPTAPLPPPPTPPSPTATPPAPRPPEETPPPAVPTFPLAPPSPLPEVPPRLLATLAPPAPAPPAAAAPPLPTTAAPPVPGLPPAPAVPPPATPVPAAPPAPPSVPALPSHGVGAGGVPLGLISIAYATAVYGCVLGSVTCNPDPSCVKVSSMAEPPVGPNR